MRLIIELVYNRNLRVAKKEQLSLRGLAVTLDLPYSTLHREIKRGLVHTPNTFNDKDVWDYSATIAQNDADERMMQKGCRMKMTNQISEALRIEIVGNKLSPNHARQRLLEAGFEYVPSTSTIYNHIAHGDIAVKYGETPYHPSRRRRGRVHPRRALKNPDHHSIEDRPAEASSREEFGHWEMDTVVSCVGGRGGLLVLIERKTRFYLISKLKAITQDEVENALRKMVASGRMKVVRSITTDNGSEFLDDKALAALFESVNRFLGIYYTHAYAAWEKGSVENCNRIVRRWYPKGTNFARVGARRIQTLQNTINSIPRQYSLTGRSAHEAFLSAA